MKITTVTVGPLATAVANNIATTQTPTSAITLNGALVANGVAVLDVPRRVLVTTTANESAKTITIVGTDGNGSPQTEIIAGPNATTGYTNIDFKTVTSMTISSGAAGALTVGTNGVASSRWIRLDEWAPHQTDISVIVSGTVNYTVQQSPQDVNNPQLNIAPYQVAWLSASDAGLVAPTASAVSWATYSPPWIKLTLNSGSGSATMTVVQYSSAPR